jgi:hypothetical protein
MTLGKATEQFNSLEWAKRKLWVLKERYILSSFSCCESFINIAFDAEEVKFLE